MTQKPELVLQWEDFDLSAANIFRNVLNDSDFCDVTLGCIDSDGQLLKAHKVILSAFSSVFKCMIKQYGTNQLNNNTVLLLREFLHRDILAILNFIYHGEVKIDVHHLESFLSTANDLKIRGISWKLGLEEKPENIKESPNNEFEISHILQSVYTDKNTLAFNEGGQNDLLNVNEISLAKHSLPYSVNENSRLNMFCGNSTCLNDSSILKKGGKRPYRKVSKAADISSKEATFSQSKKLEMDDSGANYSSQEGKRKGSKIYTHGGFGYKKHSEKNGIIHLRCRYNKKKHCKGNATISKGLLLSKMPHSCGSTPQEFRKLQAMTKLKNYAESRSGSLRKIYDEFCLTLDQNLAAAIPFCAVESAMRKRRTKSTA